MVEMETIVSLSKRRGFIFQSSEIYGGLGSAWDYGPLGVELKRNVKNLWWRDNVQLRDDMVGIDAAITMHPRVWEASGHAQNFADPFTGCAECGRYYRADQIHDALWRSKWLQALLKALSGPAAQKGAWKAITNWAQNDGKKLAPNFGLTKSAAAMPPGEPTTGFPFEGPADEKFSEFARELAALRPRAPGSMDLPCPNCGGELSLPKPANLMLKTVLGPVEETGTMVYLRPETAQGIFVNFDNILQATRKKLPFGVGQIGKSFRNEITPGNFTFRTREFEQMEIEYFCVPGTDEKIHEEWIQSRFAWYKRYGIRAENLRLREHEKTELAHYAKRCVDIEYLFPMGWSELEGIANRTDYDLKQHTQFSGKQLTYFDEEKKEQIVPYVVEPAAGADRATLAFLIDAYHEEEVRGEKRVVLRFHPEIAPVKIAVLPLLKKRDEIVALANSLRDELSKHWVTVYDDTAAIGRLYRRQDEVGTPYCVTVDVQTVGDKEKGEAGDRRVTIRDRDSMEQIRAPAPELTTIFASLLSGTPWSDVAAKYPAQAKP